ncbi:MAG: hypothetical protein A3J51_06900 [Omnitrophica WOR_2 bacterium RIFCSPHIGHO2_02_FULL_45_21]|nr:MAG: hypothetical protein A3J51_06900 [Omnitrophica WOR_2 bacterium RIFCSPHIGHO2_02_FULL_45_21]
MRLKEIYKPIRRELDQVEKVLEVSLKETKNESILKLNRFLLKSPGKRLRPAMLILSAKATVGRSPEVISRQLINLACAIELIHMASLIHDDVIDHSLLRHNNPTVNSRWGADVSIALGDYLYSLAFKLIATCNNTDILDCISSATKSMCEGELTQVVERDNFSLLKERYIMIVKKKTASLFAASCQAGAILSDSPRPLQNALKAYGLNFGVAFQIIDDYLDIAAPKSRLGKSPGQDIAVGEMTLPLLDLLKFSSKNKRYRLESLLKSKTNGCFKKIKVELSNSDAISRTKKITLSYLNSARDRLKSLSDSQYRKALLDLVDLTPEANVWKERVS